MKHLKPLFRIIILSNVGLNMKSLTTSRCLKLIHQNKNLGIKVFIMVWGQLMMTKLTLTQLWISYKKPVIIKFITEKAKSPIPPLTQSSKSEETTLKQPLKIDLAKIASYVWQVLMDLKDMQMETMHRN
jgi:hypothetical protein